MAVFEDGLLGTIGGGHLEFEAIDEARSFLLKKTPLTAPVNKTIALGPSLGQCCGGVVTLSFERIEHQDMGALENRLKEDFSRIALFGGGHVGHALADAFGRLPVQLTWIDSREAIFPSALPENIVCQHESPIEAAVDDLPDDAHVLVMSFSHAEDLDIIRACLTRKKKSPNAFPFIGLIGSKTKWARFRHQLEARGFDQDLLAAVSCPIGLTAISGKSPEVIALSVAAQLFSLSSFGRPD
jgi:xanthine dehydrogenase accessory factor